MKVVIVAKTRQGSGSCVGGITFDGRSLRLIASDKNTNDQFNNEYSIGDVWDVDYRPDPDLVPPHVENIIVHNKRRLPSIDNVTRFIEQHMPPRDGGLDVLYEGLLQATKAGVQYVAERTGIPPYSTMFWRPDKPLVRDDDAKRIRYRYPNPKGGRTLTFVGYQEPLEQIPAGTLLRVSLAHWWRPREMPEGERRCYVQLSGWYTTNDERSWNPFENWDQPLDTGPDVVQLNQPQITSKLELSEALGILKRVFGYDHFRPLQAEIIDHILLKKDSLAIMPTGSGKSICFQIPALMFPGLTVVVSPLISLMQDQVEQLHELGVPAVFLNSTLSYNEYLQTTWRIKAGQVKLLYAAPESLLRPETLLMLEQCQVDCLTIDEAHCISQWGHDFRPEYRQLLDLRRRLPAAVCLAVTATATERVRQDIKSTLGVPDANEFVASFDRENLYLAAEPRTNGLAQTIAFLEAHRDQSGIIYCSTRQAVDRLAEKLSSRGWPVLPYHAGLETEVRQHNQRRFALEENIIVVATIAFGMGINKSNVRFVIHFNLPQDIESYYQQIGRAGRDGLQADCLFLFTAKDVQTINFFIRQQDPSQQPGATQRLQAILGYCETNLCRRRPLLNYFGEAYTAASCDMCDNCLTSIDEERLADITIPAQKFLSCVKRTGEIFGVNYIIDVLRGSRSQRILARRHDRLSTYNIGREFSKKGWQYLARQFIQQDLLFQDMNHGSLKLTPQSYAVFRGERVLGMLPEQRQAIISPSSKVSFDRALFDILREKRTQLAKKSNVPPYIIFSDRSLAEMAAYFPQSRSAFASIYGVGENKLAKYADEFLLIIQEYCREHNLQGKRRTLFAQPQPIADAGSRTEELAKAYNDGHSVAELAQDLGIKQRTVIDHLWKYHQSGEKLRSDGILELSKLASAEQARALKTFDTVGSEFLRPAFDALKGTISYDELHILRLYYVSHKPQELFSEDHK